MRRGRAVAEGWPSTVAAGKPSTVSPGWGPFPREGQRKTVGGRRGALGGCVTRHPRFPGCQSPCTPASQVETPPSRGSRGWEGGAGLRAPAPPSITWPESHKNNSFGQDRDFRKGTQGPGRQPPPHGGQFSGIVREAEPPPAAAAAAASSAAARAGATSASPQL